MNSIIRFLARRVLPFIASNSDLDIDTVKKEDGVFLRVRVETLGFTIIDQLVRISQDIEADPVDVFISKSNKKALEDYLASGKAFKS